MASQTGKGIVIAYKVEATYNTAPGAADAKQLRLTPSPGLSVKRAEIKSNEVRSDGLTSLARLGSRMVDGSYSGEIAVGAFDTLFEAVMRSAWVAAVTITEATASLASITTTTSTIVASAGSWITAGVKEGDVVRLTNHSTAGNNSINLRVKTVSALTLTLVGTPLTANAVADTTFTLTILKKLKNGTTPTRRTFYWEEYNRDIDESEVFGGVRCIGMKISGSPDGMASIEFTMLGASGDVLATGSSPYFSSPTLNTSKALVFADAKICLAGTDLATATSFELNLTIAAKTEPVIGSTVSPDVFDNDCSLDGSLTVTRSALTNVSTFLAETPLDISILLVEPESEPKDCIGIFIPNVILTAVDAPLGGDGAMVETLKFTAGVSESVTGVDDSLLTISTSAA